MTVKDPNVCGCGQPVTTTVTVMAARLERCDACAARIEAAKANHVRATVRAGRTGFWANLFGIFGGG